MVANVRPRFPLGQVVATPAALEALAAAGQTADDFLIRHVKGDWGDVDADDQQANEEALRCDARLISAYRTAKGTKLWVITEADRSSTCLLLPDEY